MEYTTQLIFLTMNNKRKKPTLKERAIIMGQIAFLVLTSIVINLLMLIFYILSFIPALCNVKFFDRYVSFFLKVNKK